MLTAAVLYAKDFKQLATFYAALNDACTVEINDDFATLSDDTGQLFILQIPDALAATIEIETPPVVRSATPIKAIIQVPSLDKACAALPQFGGGLKPGASRWEFQGNWVQDIVDPEGNVVQIWQAIAAS